jgi:hypothetical protein
VRDAFRGDFLDGFSAVDFHQVERAGREVEFAEGIVEAAAGEPVEEFLEVANAGLDGCPRRL